MEIAPALVVTEGFGDIPMSDEAFALLLEHAGERVFLDGGGAFQSSAAGAADARPCLFAPRAAGDHAAGAPRVEGLAELKAGDRVRVLGFTGPLAEGIVLEIGEDDVVLESGVAAPGVKVQMAGGNDVWVPFFNVEKAD